MQLEAILLCLHYLFLLQLECDTFSCSSYLGSMKKRQMESLRPLTLISLSCWNNASNLLLLDFLLFRKTKSFCVQSSVVKFLLLAAKCMCSCIRLFKDLRSNTYKELTKVCNIDYKTLWCCGFFLFFSEGVNGTFSPNYVTTATWLTTNVHWDWFRRCTWFQKCYNGQICTLESMK